MGNVPEIYGSMVFTEHVMRGRGANACAHELVPLMEAARNEVDQLEISIPTADWLAASCNKVLIYA